MFSLRRGCGRIGTEKASAWPFLKDHFLKGYIIHAQKFSPFRFLHACPWIVRPLFNDLDKNVNYHEHSRKWHFGEIFLYTRNSFIKKWQGVFSPIQIAGLYTLYLHCICFMFKSCFFLNFRLDCYH